MASQNMSFLYSVIIIIIIIIIIALLFHCLTDY